MEGPCGVARLEALCGEDFDHVRGARERTVHELKRRRELLAQLHLRNHAAVVMVGSWGRRELTAGSDDDFLVLIDGAPEPGGSDPSVSAAVAVSELLGGTPPGREEIFGRPVYLRDLLTKIGRDEDTNHNLTRRMLLILESVPASGDELHGRAVRELIDGYLAAGVKDYRPPRFLINDLVRYWRTIAVDFEGKMRDRKGDGWGLRNAKLRLSRKALFAAGLLPVLECNGLLAEEMPDYLSERMSVAPLDRLADVFVDHGMLDSGVRALRAYDSFLEILDDDRRRRELTELRHDDRGSSETFAEVAAPSASPTSSPTSACRPTTAARTATAT